jgi:hypothetical protein
MMRLPEDKANRVEMWACQNASAMWASEGRMGVMWAKHCHQPPCDLVLADYRDWQLSIKFGIDIAAYASDFEDVYNEAFVALWDELATGYEGVEGPSDEHV